MKQVQAKFEIPEEFKAKVNHWKGQHGKVKFLDLDSDVKMEKVTDKEEGKEIEKEVVRYIPGKVLFFRQPSRQEMSAAETLSLNESGETDSYKKAEKLMVDCYLGGEMKLDEILKDIDAYMAVANYCLYNLVETKNVNWGNC